MRIVIKTELWTYEPLQTDTYLKLVSKSFVNIIIKYYIPDYYSCIAYIT